MVRQLYYVTGAQISCSHNWTKHTGDLKMNSGSWWKGFNDARRQHDYYNDHILLVDKFEYQQGYRAGSWQPNLQAWGPRNKCGTQCYRY